MSVQWVHLAPEELLVASSRGVWIQRHEPGAVGLSGPMPDSLQATPENTRKLLDGAIVAAERGVREERTPPMTAERWALQLVNQWYCAHHSVALLPEVIERYESADRADLTEFARRKLEEEQGHDQLPLADLRALGYDPEALVEEVPASPSVIAVVAYARECVRGEHPVEFLGYVYALERRATRIPADWLDALDAMLPPGVDATSGIRAHATEFDVRHVDDAVAFITALPARDRTRIAISCHRTTHITCSPSPRQHPAEAELDAWLSRFKRAGPARTAKRS